jgi:UDP-glucose 4-epimerase
MSISKVILLGHNGLIGRYVEAQFRSRSPEIEIIGCSLPEFDLLYKDHVASLAELMGPQTAVVFLSGIKRQLGDDLDTFNKNMLMVTNLVPLLERCSPGRLVYVSSGAVYGEEIDNLAISEETPVRPISYYGIAKYASECLLRKVVAAKPAMSLVCVRPPLVYGPGDASCSYGPAGFVKNVVEGKEIVLWGEGDELREFVYVEDLGRLLYEMTFSSYQGVLNAASGHSRNFRDILNILRSLAGPIQVTARARSKNKVDNVYDACLLQKVCPQMQFTSLEIGIQKTYEAEQHS